MKKLIILFLVLVLIGGGVYFFFFRSAEPDVQAEDLTANASNEEVSLNDFIESLDQEARTLTESSVRSNIVGTWGSLDREGYEIEFKSSGEMTETLDPSQTIGSWDLVSFEEGPNEVVGAVAFSQEGVFLKQSLDNGQANFYYKIVQANEERLVLLFLHQAGILGFERI